MAQGTFSFGTKTNPQGVTFEVDSRGFIVGGKHILPVMGEIHYARVPAAEWKREIQKMRAGGITIIATGHSGADCGLSYNSFEYFRLYLLTGDEYLLKIARLLAYNTKQTMDYDGKLGYGHRGLQTEALRLVTNRGDGVNLWLPWVTATQLDPLCRLKDAYGSIELNDIAKMPADELQRLDRQYRRTQGLAF